MLYSPPSAGHKNDSRQGDVHSRQPTTARRGRRPTTSRPPYGRLLFQGRTTADNCPSRTSDFPRTDDARELPVQNVCFSKDGRRPTTPVHTAHRTAGCFFRITGQVGVSVLGRTEGSGATETGSPNKSRRPTTARPDRLIFQERATADNSPSRPAAFPKTHDGQELPVHTAHRTAGCFFRITGQVGVSVIGRTEGSGDTNNS